MYFPEFENVLNVSLNVPEEERMRSEILNTGYSPQENTWELVVRCSVYPESFLEMHPEVVFRLLTGNYIIMRVPERLLGELAQTPGVIYIEIPKRLYMGNGAGHFSAAQVDSVQVSGIPLLKERLGINLTGRGVLVGIADSGIDIFHQAFRKQDGSTRIAALWDQASGEYTKEEINAFLEGNYSGPLPSAFRDLSGHGTAVAGIAAGSRVEESGMIAEGYAPESELVVVRLGQSGSDDYVKTTQLMQAVDYLVKKASELGRPMAINLSIGNNYGSHSGRSLLSTYLTETALSERLTICVGSGNEAGKSIHTSVRLGDMPYEILLPVARLQPSFSIQLWKNYADICQIQLISPSGEMFRVYYDADILAAENPVRRYRSGRTQIVIYNGLPSPYQPLQEIFMDLIPADQFVDSGNWRIQIMPVRIVSGNMELWLPAGNILNQGTGFAVPGQQHTLTVPSASERVITVGAYDSRTQTYASFSGRGFTAFTNQVKPDLAAPGVDVLAPRAGGGTLEYAGFTGTSFASPAVAGAAALLMQWGIVEGNDPWLYGERLKSWFHRNARQLPAFQTYPNAYIGYGVL
ncbi:MAG: S8 family serine peptidase [Lachnospiraceae bacterium]|nr:S8 family serine peptidase [Lachnospiraceae bacterium]MDY4970097.1 S8 family peptidase [Lachnospiraceae bacterium]